MSRQGKILKDVEKWMFQTSVWAPFFNNGAHIEISVLLIIVTKQGSED